MGISVSNIVDLVTHDRSRDEIAVIMIADAPWSDSPELQDQIVAKLNTYVAFIEQGLLAQRFPQLAGKAARIQIDCDNVPTGMSATTIKQAQELLMEHGIAVAVNVIVKAGADAARYEDGQTSLS